MTLFSSTKDRPWSTVDPADAQPCGHVCEMHPAPRHDGPRISLQELDAAARELPYSPGPGVGYDRNAGRQWILGQSAQVPAAYLGSYAGAPTETFDPSPLGVCIRARRGWLDIAGRIPEGFGPATLRDHNPEVASLASLIASLDVLDAAGLEELMAQ
jgi:hypothetical protein